MILVILKNEYMYLLAKNIPDTAEIEPLTLWVILTRRIHLFDPLLKEVRLVSHVPFLIYHMPMRPMRRSDLQSSREGCADRTKHADPESIR